MGQGILISPLNREFHHNRKLLKRLSVVLTHCGCPFETVLDSASHLERSTIDVGIFLKTVSENLTVVRLLISTLRLSVTGPGPVDAVTDPVCGQHYCGLGQDDCAGSIGHTGLTDSDISTQQCSSRQA